MRKFLMVSLAILCVAVVTYMFWLVSTNIITFNEPLFMKKEISISLVIYMMIFSFALLSASTLIFFGCKTNKKDLNAYKNKYEKIAIENEEESAKVKVLEEKIKSLEIALSKALEK